MVALRLHERLRTLAAVSDSLFNWADAVVLIMSIPFCALALVLLPLMCALPDPYIPKGGF